MISAACSGEKGDKEPDGERAGGCWWKNTTIQHVIKTQAILFPRQQAAIVAKITAPVQKFLVKRGSPVHQGRVAGCARKPRSERRRAGKQGKPGTGASRLRNYHLQPACRRKSRKRKRRRSNPSRRWRRRKRSIKAGSRSYEQGALPRKELDQSGVEIIQARNQYAIARKHLDTLLALESSSNSRPPRGQLESAKGKYRGAEAQLNSLRDSQSIDGSNT